MARLVRLHRFGILPALDGSSINLTVRLRIIGCNICNVIPKHYGQTAKTITAAQDTGCPRTRFAYYTGTDAFIVQRVLRAL